MIFFVLKLTHNFFMSNGDLVGFKFIAKIVKKKNKISAHFINQIFRILDSTIKKYISYRE